MRLKSKKSVLETKKVHPSLINSSETYGQTDTPIGVGQSHALSTETSLTHSRKKKKFLLERGTQT